MLVSITFILRSSVDLQLVDECFVGSVQSELDQIHHHQVGVEAGVALAGRTTQLAARRLDMVRPEGAEISGGLLLHHGDTLLVAELQELVVQLPHVVVEGDMPDHGVMLVRRAMISFTHYLST